jgi:hypothetical protein
MNSPMSTVIRTAAVSAAALAAMTLTGTATAADLTTADHHQAVAAVAAGAHTTDRPAAQVAATGPGAQPVAPATLTTTPQQVTDRSGAAQVSVGGAAILLLGAGVWYAVRKGGHKIGWMLCSFALGVLLAGGALGSMTQQFVTSIVTSASTLGGNL